MKWYIDALKKYAVFSGRARRKEYWMYTLFNCIAFAVLVFVGFAVGTLIPYFLYLIAIILPTLAVGVRRLHDTGKSGWLMLIILIPLIGGVILFAFDCVEGNRGPNRYGPDPKMADAAAYMPPPQPQY